MDSMSDVLMSAVVVAEQELRDSDGDPVFCGVCGWPVTEVHYSDGDIEYLCSDSCEDCCGNPPRP